jgi:transcriptional regulator with XRE-family HTH domain
MVRAPLPNYDPIPTVTIPPRTDINVTITPTAPSRTTTKSSSTSSGTVGPATKTVAAPKLSQEELAQQYGLTAAMISAYPELKNLFDQAVREQWTADKFQAKFRNTEWYKTKSDATRKALIMQYTDPATYGKLWNTTQGQMRQIMAEMGADPDNWEIVNAVSGKMILEGWSESQARDYLGQYIVFGAGGLAHGKAGEIQEKLNSYAYAMGVQNSDWWMQDAVRAVVRGAKSEQDFKNDITSQAIAAFPQYEKQLRAGSTLSDLAQPYTQSMSQILEIPPGTVNMFDPTIRKAMSFKDKAGMASAMPLWDFQNSLRQDERWKKTQNAQDSTMGVAHKVLQDFGVYY